MSTRIPIEGDDKGILMTCLLHIHSMMQVDVVYQRGWL